MYTVTSNAAHTPVISLRWYGRGWCTHHLYVVVWSWMVHPSSLCGGTVVDDHYEAEISAYVSVPTLFVQWHIPERMCLCFYVLCASCAQGAILTKQAHCLILTGHSDQGRQDISRNCSLLRRQGAPHCVAMGVGAVLRFDQPAVFFHRNAHDSRGRTVNDALLLHIGVPFVALLATLCQRCTRVYSDGVGICAREPSYARLFSTNGTRNKALS